MSMLDDLLEIKKRMDALKPKDHIDIILSTRLYIPAELSLRIEYRGKAYLISNWATVEKMKAQCVIRERERSPTSMIRYDPGTMFGVPVVENDDLVREILLHHLFLRKIENG